MNRKDFEKEVGKALKKRLEEELDRKPSDDEYKYYIDKNYEKYKCSVNKNN